MSVLVFALALALVGATVFLGTGARAAEIPDSVVGASSPGVRALVVFDKGTFGTSRMTRNLSAADAEVLGVIARQRTLVVTLPSQVEMERLAGRTGVLRVEFDVPVRMAVRRTVRPTTTTSTTKPPTTTSSTTTTTAPTTTTSTSTTTTTSTSSTTSTTSTTAPPSNQVMPWGIARLAAPTVWAAGASAGSKGSDVNVAVFDTGIDLDHPDLAANIEGGYMAITNSTLYRDNRSYDDDNGHGTHVAGIIASVDNLYGVVGVAPAVDLYAVKVLDKYGSGWMSDIARAVYWAIATHADANPNNDIQVINMSLGSDEASTTLRTALADAEAAGILLVAAAGNDGGAVDYPAAEPQVIAVAATDSANRVPSWSSRGPQVELAAPGAVVVSTYRGGLFAWKSGTSMAAPHVSGAAALVWAARPWLTAAEVRAILAASAEDMSTPGRDDVTGAGLVRPDRALGL